jgi:hypothetical protein
LCFKLKKHFWFQVEPFWVPCRTLCTEHSTWNPKGFYLGPKRLLLLGQLKNPFEPFFYMSVGVCESGWCWHKGLSLLFMAARWHTMHFYWWLCYVGYVTGLRKCWLAWFSCKNST